jgi:NAD(P)-dependent dehydrogenase (short-subunit alcohol dehydrogenase family)/glyoxylase-like metal-dependent hydrolase (beta-lactamase superfamily II)
MTMPNHPEPDSLADLAAAGFTTARLDVTDDASMATLVDRITVEHGAVSVLVNNAGFELVGPVEETPLAQARRQFEVNFFGLARLTLLVLPGMRCQGGGTIINLSSVFGRFAVPGNTYYSASKHAVAAFTGALRLELAPFGIRAVLIEPTAARTSLNSNTAWAPAPAPGSTYTSFYEDLADWHAQTYAGPPHNMAGRLAVSPDQVAAAITRAATARRPRASYPVGTLARGLFALRRWLPAPAFAAFVRSQFPVPRPVTPGAVTPRRSSMPDPIVTDYVAEALKTAACWPGADRATLITLATVLAATGADADGAAFFGSLAASQPGQALPLALAGFFEVRQGRDIPAGLAKLDEAASNDLGPSQYYRGLALAGLPDAGQAKQAVADLEFVLAVRDQFPTPMIRAAHHGLAAAHTTLGNHDQAAQAAAATGLATAPPGARLEFSGFWMNAAEGFHFTSPRITEPAPGIQVAQGYDFGDFAFLTTGDGIVAIDAGTAPHRAAAALTDAGLTAGDVTHVILTHAHFDHAGGIAALVGPRTTVIAQAGFSAELDRQHTNYLPFGYFTGRGAGFGRGGPATPATITVDQPIAEPTTLTVGGTELVLYPATGGETPDALMIYLPGAGVLFTGDVMMPYLGAPFFAEGSPDGLIEALEFITGLGPRLLVHGHTPLTELFTAQAAVGLLPALRQLREQAVAGIQAGKTLTGLLEANLLPEVLREHPAAVGPYLAIRDHFLQRLYHTRTGYWQPDGQGLEPIAPHQRAAALDLLAGGEPDRFAGTARTLLAQRDHALALEITTAGLARHPGHPELTQLRQQALHRLMERHQLQEPFRYLIYAELAGVELGPVR